MDGVFRYQITLFACPRFTVMKWNHNKAFHCLHTVVRAACWTKGLLWGGLWRRWKLILGPGDFSVWNICMYKKPNGKYLGNGVLSPLDTDDF